MIYLSRPLVESYARYLESHAQRDDPPAEAGYPMLKRLGDILIIWGLGLGKLSDPEGSSGRANSPV